MMGSNEMRKVKQKTMREDEDEAAAAAEEDEKLFINRFSRRKKNQIESTQIEFGVQV